MKIRYGLLVLLVPFFVQQVFGMEEKMVLFEKNPQVHAWDGYRDLNTLNKLEAMAQRAYDDLSQMGMAWLIKDEALKCLKKAKEQRKPILVPLIKVPKEELKRIAIKQGEKIPLSVSKKTLAGLVQLVQLNGGYIKLWLLMRDMPLMNVQLFEKNGNWIHIDGPILEAARAAKLPPFHQ